MGVLWDKVWRDLWENKGRTIQVVLIIAVGTFAIGMIIGTRQFMITGMQMAVGHVLARRPSICGRNPASTTTRLAVLRRIDGVTAVEGIAQARN